MSIFIVGLDLGKSSCSVCALDESGRVIHRKRIRRDRLASYVEETAPSIVAMEACCGAHHLGRLFAALGCEVRLMPPEYVRPYVKAQKNDDRDAEAIAEAATRPTMRFVPLKSEEQLDIQSLHRARSRLVGERTALINYLRAVLLERGFTAPQGRRRLEKALDELSQSKEVTLSQRIWMLVDDLRAEWRALDERIAAFDTELLRLARENDASRRLMTIPGVGTLNATALQAAIGDGSAFTNGRDLAAWLGLVPRQMTTGGKPKLGGISKRGNFYLRMNLIHGARAALPVLQKQETPLGKWLRDLASRTHVNVVVVALAAKLARIAWAVLRKGSQYIPQGSINVNTAIVTS